MSEFTLTENDYAELKSLTLDELKYGREEILDDLDATIDENDVRPTPLLQESIEEMHTWLKAYDNEIAKRTVITTPLCRGCKEGALNQLGHIGPNGCLEEPGLDICPY